MIGFEYYNPTRIIFGQGKEELVGEHTAAYAKKVLLHYGGSSAKKTGLYDKIIKSLEENRVEYVELGGVVPNPRLSLVNEGIKLCREHGLEFILAVGGGSVIDSAKAIAAGVCYDGDIWEDYFMQPGRSITKAIPIGVVLTIPAAGSETSGGSVVTCDYGEYKDYKRDIGGDCLRPRFSILNPELTYTLPDYQIACGASDIMAHCMERYFTPTKSVDFSDRLLESTLRTMINYTPLALTEQYKQDYEVRAQIMWAGTLAHCGLFGVDRRNDWASHNIEHELSGIYDIAHGAGLSIIFPAWMKYVYKQDIDRFVQYARRVWDVDFADGEKELIALEGIARTERFFRSLGLPVTLTEAGIPSDRLREMADKSLTSKKFLGGFMELNADDVYEIFKLSV